VCSSVLRTWRSWQLHIHAHCSTLHHNAAQCTTLHHSAPQCNTLYHTALHYTMQHHTAPHCNTAAYISGGVSTTLHRTASRCTALQHTATHCNTTRRCILRSWQSQPCAPSVPIRSHYTTLQHTATRCNTLQHNSRYTWRSWQSQPCAPPVIHLYTYALGCMYTFIHIQAYMWPSTCVNIIFIHITFTYITLIHCNTLQQTLQHTATPIYIYHIDINI